MQTRVTLAVSFLFAIFSIAEGNPCSQDWELYEESCYGFGEALMTWGDAAEMCQAVGARLAEIETSAENDFLKSQANNKGDISYWLGGTDVFHEGTWIWTSTRELISFSDWGEGQPDDTGDHEDCLVLRKDKHYQWNDVACDNKYTFICEMPAGEETVVG